MRQYALLDNPEPISLSAGYRRRLCRDSSSVMVMAPAGFSASELSALSGINALILTVAQARAQIHTERIVWDGAPDPVVAGAW